MKKYINENLPINQRVGQIGINNQGEKMTIIAYRGADDIDIQFEDGVTIYNNCYGNFRTGNIKHPIRYEESFAYHIEVELGLNLDDIWNWEKNNENGINPYKIYKCSGKKVWLYCQEKDYHNDNGGYEISCANFSSRGIRCPYCYNRKVHSKDSFAQWGIDTFGEDFLERYWSSYNTLDPWEIAPQSLKKVWLYCQEKDYHNWDKKGNKIGYETNCHNFYNGERCGYCGSKKKVHYKDSLAYNYPNIVKMIAIPKNGITSDDCLELPCSSKDSFYISCLDCNTISNKKYTLNQITRYGYSCKKCSDGISIPNKFMTNILNQLNIKFEPEYSPYYFRNSQHVDFLLIDYNIIIEMDGGYGNHTREYDYWRDFLNMKYGGYKTIRIDLTNNKEYNNTFIYIKEQIISSELSNIFDLTKINWELAWEESQNSLCVKTWELWNDGIDDIKEISKELDLNEATIRKYLKIGNELNKCNYKTKLEKKEENIKKVLELYNSGVYNIKEISKELDLDETTIRKYLKNIKKINNNKIKVICMTTKKLFLSMIEGAKFYNINYSHISSCCNGNRNSCGKLSNGTPLVWRYINISHNRILRGENIKLLRKEVCK